MKRIVVAGMLVLAVAGAGGVLATSQDALPPGHPPVVPPGHPPVKPPPTTTAPDALPPGHPPLAPDAAAARVEDVNTIASIVASYYESLSGPKGAPRDWERFRSLFAPGGLMVTIIEGRFGDATSVLTPAQFAKMNGRYFQAGGYRERSLLDHVDRFGRIAHVRSTYDSRRGDAEPYARGVNSFQLVRSDGRWWIVSVLWEREHAKLPLRPEHLPADAASG